MISYQERWREWPDEVSATSHFGQVLIPAGECRLRDKKTDEYTNMESCKEQSAFFLTQR